MRCLLRCGEDPYSFRNRRTFEPEKRTMTIWNYVVTAHKPTNVTHSYVGNLIIAYLLILFPFPRVPFFSFIFVSTYLPFHFVFLPGNARASRFTCFLPKACRLFCIPSGAGFVIFTSFLGFTFECLHICM